MEGRGKSVQSEREGESYRQADKDERQGQADYWRMVETVDWQTAR